MVSNNSTAPITTDIWTEIVLPNVGWIEVLNVPNMTIPGGASPNRDRTQVVPANAPAGVYTYYGCVGDIPG